MTDDERPEAEPVIGDIRPNPDEAILGEVWDGTRWIQVLADIPPAEAHRLRAENERLKAQVAGYEHELRHCMREAGHG